MVVGPLVVGGTTGLWFRQKLLGGKLELMATSVLYWPLFDSIFVLPF